MRFGDFPSYGALAARSSGNNENRLEKPVCQEEAYCETDTLLMAQYKDIAIIPVEWVVRDFFRHLTVKKFLRKTLTGEIALSVVRME